jgi:FKBP-type peptidyl-prolyl cis-trans isomerase
MKHLLLLFNLCIVSLACQQTKKTPQVKVPTQQQLLDVNKRIAHENSQAIDEYTNRHHWVVQRTGTGLRYFIYKKGEGKEIKKGSNVTFRYYLSLMDGTELIKRDKPEQKTIIVEQEDAETGLHEMLQLLRAGDEAKVILPPHLAFGLTGTEKVPPYSTLIYDVSIVQVE